MNSESSVKPPKETCIKIITIGDSRVGKSSIIARYVDGNYYHNLPSTIGIDYKVKKLQYEGKDIKLNIWDTAGQEKFRSITLNFYKGVDGIILVFDITDENSFTNIPHWIRQIKLYASENCAMVLLGNKCDMMDRKISKDRIDECCTEYGLKYFESSAKMNINIEQAFITIVKDISLKETVKETVENPSILPSGGEESEIKEKKGKNGIILGKKKKKDDDEISDISQCQC